MRCKVEGCASQAVAGGMCAKHYMRVKRRGDPNVRLRPGPKPGPAPAAAAASELAALRAEAAALRQENAGLQRELTKARAAAAKPNPPKPAKPPRPRDEEIASLRRRVRKLRADFDRIFQSPRRMLVISRADRRKIQAALHPDTTTDPARKQRLTVASQIFNSLRMTDVELD